MILLVISLIVMFSAIVIYSGFHGKPKQHYVRRISMRHVKLGKILTQHETLENELEEEHDFILLEEDT